MPPAHTANLADTILRLLEERLPKKTREHTLSVALLMEDAALDLNIDPAGARIAGLAHDLFKGMSGEEMLAQAEKWGLPISEYQRQRPKMLHGFLAARELADMGVHEDDVLDAVSWHTTGRPGLSDMGLLLYFADFSEPMREHDEAAEARKIFRKHGLLKAVLFVADSKAHYASKKAPLDPVTLDFAQWLHSRIKEEKA